MAVEKVKEYFEKLGIGDKVKVLGESSATVELAAKAIGCECGDIAKTLSFMVDNNPILIVMAGDYKTDNQKFKATFNCKASMIPFDMVESLIGHAVGGVCPFAVNDGVKVYLDESLKGHEFVYPAAGSSNSVIKLSLEELEKYSNYESWVDVSKIIE